jgi:hypothetical protein
MVIDLNRLLLYADAAGCLHNEPERRFFSLVDGIVAGEGNGPLDASPKSAGVVLAGTNPVAVDLACARVMGFDYRRIPMLNRALERHRLPLIGFEYSAVTGRSNDPALRGPMSEWRGPMLAFEPHFGWEGHIEVEDAHEACAFA